MMEINREIGQDLLQPIQIGYKSRQAVDIEPQVELVALSYLASHSVPQEKVLLRIHFNGKLVKEPIAHMRSVKYDLNSESDLTFAFYCYDWVLNHEEIGEKVRWRAEFEKLVTEYNVERENMPVHLRFKVSHFSAQSGVLVAAKQLAALRTAFILGIKNIDREATISGEHLELGDFWSYAKNEV